VPAGAMLKCAILPGAVREASDAAARLVDGSTGSANCRARGCCGDPASADFRQLPDQLRRDWRLIRRGDARGRGC